MKRLFVVVLIALMVGGLILVSASCQKQEPTVLDKLVEVS